ncbi:MAG TPA: hypothetical protein VGM43_23400 [Bryobacteraceae bacterium]|jgi:hypothetical protein
MTQTRPQNYLVYITVTAGDQLSLTPQFQTHVSVGCQAFAPVLCTATASGDASHTPAFTQVGFQDNNGNWISGDQSRKRQQRARAGKHDL